MKKDILKEEFEKEIELPESLSKNNMIKMLQEKGITPEKKVKVKILPKVLSAAAMLAIITVAVFSIGLRSEFVDVEDQSTPTTAPAVLPSEQQSNEQPETEEKKEAPKSTNLKIQQLIFLHFPRQVQAFSQKVR